MGDPGTIQLEDLAPRHELGLAEFFCALSSNGDGEHFYPHPLTEKEAQRLCRYTGLDQYFVAKIAGRIFGYGMLRGWDEGYTIPSLGLATHPDARGQGIGKFLLCGLIQQAQNRGASHLRLTADPNRGRIINFFARHGFVFRPSQPGRVVGMLDLQKAQ